jgi:hypothetical protein
VYNPTVEQYFGCVCDGIENGQGFLELLIIIVTEGFDPSLYFLQTVSKESFNGPV